MLELVPVIDWRYSNKEHTKESIMINALPAIIILAIVFAVYKINEYRHEKLMEKTHKQVLASRIEFYKHHRKPGRPYLTSN